MAYKGSETITICKKRLDVKEMCAVYKMRKKERKKLVGGKKEKVAKVMNIHKNIRCEKKRGKQISGPSFPAGLVVQKKRNSFCVLEGEVV